MLLLQRRDCGAGRRQIVEEDGINVQRGPASGDQRRQREAHRRLARLAHFSRIAWVAGWPPKRKAALDQEGGPNMPRLLFEKP